MRVSGLRIAPNVLRPPLQRVFSSNYQNASPPIQPKKISKAAIHPHFEKYHRLTKQAEENFLSAMHSHIDSGRNGILRGLFGQTKTGFSQWEDPNLSKTAWELFPDEMSQLKLDKPPVSGKKTVVEVVLSTKDKFTKNNPINIGNHVYVGGPASMYASAACSYFDSSVVFINDGEKAIHHGSARVMHSEETQQNENPLCYNAQAIATYLKRSILPPSKTGFNWNYLRLDAIAPGTFSSIENIRNWSSVMTGMGMNIVSNLAREKLTGSNQWYQDVKATRASADVLRWLQKSTESPLLFEGLGGKGEPPGQGKYVYLAKGPDIAKRVEFNEKLKKMSLVEQEELSADELIEMFPGAEKDIKQGELRGWRTPGNGLINANFQELLEKLVRAKGGSIIQGTLKQIHVNNDGDVLGIQVISKQGDNHYYDIETLFCSLGHSEFVLGDTPITSFQTLLGTRNPFGFGVPATGTSATGISFSHTCPTKQAVTGLVNMHRNHIATKEIEPKLWATLWRTTTGGNVGGPVVKNGYSQVETYPGYYLSAMNISKYLFGNKYPAEAPFNVVACPRELTTKEQPSMHVSGKFKSLVVWTGWQGLGVERPPSIVFQHLLMRNPDMINEICNITGLSEELISEGKFQVVDITKDVCNANLFQAH